LTNRLETGILDQEDYIFQPRITGWGGGVQLTIQLPECQKCHQGVLLPLSDYGREGASIHYKAWVCSNPACGFNIRIDNGELSIGKVVERSNK